MIGWFKSFFKSKDPTERILNIHQMHTLYLLNLLRNHILDIGQGNRIVSEVLDRIYQRLDNIELRFNGEDKKDAKNESKDPP